MAKNSIMKQLDGTCWLCVNLRGDWSTKDVLHEHHVFGGPNRKISDANGFTVKLCLKHHVVGPTAVHNNKAMMRILQQETQREYEKTHTREEFMGLIGRNYL